MSTAYLDSSYLLAILFGEPRAPSLGRVLQRFDDLVSGDLLVAEVLSAARRESIGVESVAPALQDVSLVLPDRTLQLEMEEVLETGRLRGADLWHVACAMFAAGPARAEVTFLSRDPAQRRVAGRLGFRVR